jgi:hypothetical protein
LELDQGLLLVAGFEEADPGLVVPVSPLKHAGLLSPRRGARQQEKREKRSEKQAH